GAARTGSQGGGFAWSQGWDCRMTNITIDVVAASLFISKRSAERRAVREGWPYQEQTCRGGRRRVYRIDSLPTDVRRAVELYQARQAAGLLNQPAPGGELIQAGACPLPAHSSPAATGAG